MVDKLSKICSYPAVIFREKIATGQVIKALILNGLGMVSRPLYLFSQFFEDKAIEKLLGISINTE